MLRISLFVRLKYTVKKGFKLQLNQNLLNFFFSDLFFRYTCWQFNRFKINLLLNYVRKVCNKLCFPLWNENPHWDIDYHYFMRYDNKLVGYNLLSRKIYLWKFCCKKVKICFKCKEIETLLTKRKYTVWKEHTYETYLLCYTKKSYNSLKTRKKYTIWSLWLTG